MSAPFDASHPSPARHAGGAGIPPPFAVRLREAARAFADHWLPRACALCDRPLLLAEAGLCTPCREELPGAHSPRCPGCAIALPEHAARPAHAAHPERRADPAHPTHAAGHPRCARCRAEPPPWDYAVVLADYAPPLDRLIVALKFHGELPAAAALGGLLADALWQSWGLPPGRASQPHDASSLRARTSGAAQVSWPELLTPVPLSAPRLAARGYNQAQAIAAAAARRLGLPLAPCLLERVRDTPAQSALPLAARHANLEGALRARAGAGAEGRCVAVVDDVMTTGATARAAALALKAAGARCVLNLAVARTP